MKNKKRVHHGTGWAQLSGCASCPGWPSGVCEVGQRNLLISCDCPSCPRCPSEISTLYRAVRKKRSTLLLEQLQQIQNYLGHLGHVGQLAEMMMEKLSQEEELHRTELGQKTNEECSEAQRAGAIEEVFPSLVGLFLPLALVLSEPLLQQDSYGFRSAVYPIAEAKVIQPLNEFLISNKDYFGLLGGHSLFISRSGEGCKSYIDSSSYIGYIYNISRSDRRF